MFNKSRNIVEDLKGKFKEFENECKGILLFGSFIGKEPTKRSDIDICIIKPSENMINNLYKKYGGKYDFKIFENLPLYMKINIIDCHATIYGNELELSEYFYFFRKLWKDMEHRIKENQFKSFEERMQYRRKWLNEKEKILREIRTV